MAQQAFTSLIGLFCCIILFAEYIYIAEAILISRIRSRFAVIDRRKNLKVKLVIAIKSRDLKEAKKNSQKKKIKAQALSLFLLLV